MRRDTACWRSAVPPHPPRKSTRTTRSVHQQLRTGLLMVTGVADTHTAVWFLFGDPRVFRRESTGLPRRAPTVTEGLGRRPIAAQRQPTHSMSQLPPSPTPNLRSQPRTADWESDLNEFADNVVLDGVQAVHQSAAQVIIDPLWLGSNRLIRARKWALRLKPSAIGQSHSQHRPGIAPISVHRNPIGREKLTL